MTVEEFIGKAIRSSLEKRPEAEAYFKAAQKMTADSGAPEEVRSLGRILQRILTGDRGADLTRLPQEWADAIRKALG